MVRWVKVLIEKLRGLFAEQGGVYYAGSQLTLPPPLTKDRESLLCELLQCGDRAAREELIVHNLRLVVYIARKFESSGLILDDLIQIGPVGLIKAVETFSPGKNIKLATYASRCIENEILMVLRKQSSRKGEISLEEPLNVDWDGNELLLSDILGTDENIVTGRLEDAVDLQLLRQALKELPIREQEIVWMRYGLEGRKEMTQKEVAQKMGISQSYISRLEKKIMGKLKKQIISKTNCA